MKRERQPHARRIHHGAHPDLASPTLYRLGPFRLAVRRVIALGIYRLNVLSDFDAPGYILMGILLLVTALTIAVIYGLQEKQFRKAMRQPLMVYAGPVWLKEIIAKNSAEIRARTRSCCS
jgi:hypothetical protein